MLRAPNGPFRRLPARAVDAGGAPVHPFVPTHCDFDLITVLIGFGRIVVSEIEAPNAMVDLV